MEYLDRKTGKPLARNAGGGLVCIKCGCKHFIRVYTDMKTDNKITRMRECRHCGHRILTTETVKMQVHSYIGTESSETE